MKKEVEHRDRILMPRFFRNGQEIAQFAAARLRWQYEDIHELTKWINRAETLLATTDNESAYAKLFLEMNPSYFLPRMFLGSEYGANLIKSVSSYVEYQSLTTLSTSIIPNSVNVSYITSQNSNIYTSNVFTTQVKLEIPSGTVLSNSAVDGPNGGYYTLYHRIPGGMASLVNVGFCGITIGPRGGFINEFPLYDNRQGQTNTVFMHVYNN
jgi:hypothetical protein